MAERDEMKVRRVLVITNDSEVFLSDKWVSAHEMFGGRVTEVRNLVERLRGFPDTDVSMGIVSGEFGFVPSNYVIRPYGNVPSCKEDYLELQERKDYVKHIGDAANLHVGKYPIFDRVVVCVPKDMFDIIAPCLPRDRVIAVTSDKHRELCESKGWTFLERKGARVGDDNADAIVAEVESIVKPGFGD
ncbi:MAG: hypothetical protein GX224_02515 [Thermoplasmatales archaeon]|nr:hypothetical protein [Thermoplasmatales archaeon]